MNCIMQIISPCELLEHILGYVLLIKVKAILSMLSGFSKLARIELSGPYCIMISNCCRCLLSCELVHLTIAMNCSADVHLLLRWSGMDNNFMNIQQNVIACVNVIRITLNKLHIS